MKSRMWGDADEAQAEYDALIAVYAAAKAYSGMGFPREGSDRTHHITMRLRVRQALAAVDAIIGEVILD